MTTPKKLRSQHDNQDRSKPSVSKPMAPDSVMMKAIFNRIDEMEQTPASGITMCHEQGKTAVYVSDDRKYIIEHPPHGPVTRTLRAPKSQGQ